MMLAGLWSPGWTVAGGATAKMARSHGQQIHPGLWWEAHKPVHMASAQVW